jgi:hypothetical protein
MDLRNLQDIRIAVGGMFRQSINRFKKKWYYKEVFTIIDCEFFPEQPLCGVLILKLYFDKKYNLDSRDDIKTLKRELKYCKKSLEKEFYASANQWIRMQEHNS